MSGKQLQIKNYHYKLIYYIYMNKYILCVNLYVERHCQRRLKEKEKKKRMIVNNTEIYYICVGIVRELTVKYQTLLKVSGF
jgi:hypothetical protein